MATAIRRMQRNILQDPRSPHLPHVHGGRRMDLKNIGPHFPFIKFARSDRYTYHLPPVKSQAYQNFYQQHHQPRPGARLGAPRHHHGHHLAVQCPLRPLLGLPPQYHRHPHHRRVVLGRRPVRRHGHDRPHHHRGRAAAPPRPGGLVKRIVDNGCVADLFTNGSLLTEENLKRCSSSAGATPCSSAWTAPTPRSTTLLRGVDRPLRDGDRGHPAGGEYGHVRGALHLHGQGPVAQGLPPQVPGPRRRAGHPRADHLRPGALPAS